VVWWEETGQGTTRAAGGGVQARGPRGAEITSGTSLSQPGLTATGNDPLDQESEGSGRVWAWRMSPEERGRRGNVRCRGTRGHGARGHTVREPRGSGHVAGPGGAGQRRAGEPWNDRGSHPVWAGVSASQR
jgi:hypothetical protein